MIYHDHKGWTQDVQQEGYTAALRGEGKDNPYGQSLPGYTHWIYGYMLGWAERKKGDTNARG